jgi:hypothetical protein
LPEAGVAPDFARRLGRHGLDQPVAAKPATASAAFRACQNFDCYSVVSRSEFVDRRKKFHCSAE